MSEPDDIPWKTLSTALGDVPFFVIKFDERGECTSPTALERMIEAQKTDLFLFSHGWNNDWRAATERYDRFISRFIEVRQADWNPPDRAFQPVCAGVFWPSAALVAPWERAPAIAGAAGLADPDVATLGDALEPHARARFLAIASDPDAGESEAAELATILAPLLTGEEDEIETGEPTTSPGDLLEAWRAASTHGGEPAGPPGGFIDDDVPAAERVAPEAAGWNPLTLIRDGIRLTTVLLMKDRAGRVGGNGVARMLREIADGCPGARISLAGHSYGAKVVLSALCNGPAPSRIVDSVLLLQPALSCYAFTAGLDGHVGGYRPALDRVREPIVTTYSRNDVPLTRFFHLAVRRKSDLAEAQIAGQPPSKFAALGGFGPQGVEADWIEMPAEGEPYPLAVDRRIIAVDGTRFISGHGAVETPQTAWALLSQVRG
ncbi:MAG TPA: hypothetical protein DHU96_31600 [Actinobacteria bacterium]|nr:hypothetical protein [Actinomycetota bacterium]